MTQPKAQGAQAEHVCHLTGYRVGAGYFTDYCPACLTAKGEKHPGDCCCVECVVAAPETSGGEPHKRTRWIQQHEPVWTPENECAFIDPDTKEICGLLKATPPTPPAESAEAYWKEWRKTHGGPFEYFRADQAQEFAEAYLARQHAALVAERDEAKASNWANRRRADSAEGQLARAERELAAIAEQVAKTPTVTGLQEACVKDHSLIRMAISDMQQTWKDTVKRLHDKTRCLGNASGDPTHLCAAWCHDCLAKVGEARKHKSCPICAGEVGDFSPERHLENGQYIHYAKSGGPVNTPCQKLEQGEK